MFAAPTDDILPAVWTYREEAPENSFQVLLLQRRSSGVLTLEVQPEEPVLGQEAGWFTIHRTDKPIPDGVAEHALVQSLNVVKPGVRGRSQDGCEHRRHPAVAHRHVGHQVRSRNPSGRLLPQVKTGALTNFLAALLPIASRSSRRCCSSTPVGSGAAGAFVRWAVLEQDPAHPPDGLGRGDAGQVWGCVPPCRRAGLGGPVRLCPARPLLRPVPHPGRWRWTVRTSGPTPAKPPPGTEPGSSGYDPSYATAWGRSASATRSPMPRAASPAGRCRRMQPRSPSSSSGAAAGSPRWRFRRRWWRLLVGQDPSSAPRPQNADG